MKKWEYCDVTWQPEQVMVTQFIGGQPKAKAFDAANWTQILSKLGADGWELVSTTASPMGVHEYYFYFKRPLESE